MNQDEETFLESEVYCWVKTVEELEDLFGELSGKQRGKALSMLIATHVGLTQSRKEHKLNPAPPDHASKLRDKHNEMLKKRREETPE